eukprot:TRINITY_DN2413_c1_g1_i1.p1 TRINITY_DN2413_c1_g1~~TRINITY_DN2413_c1_g1_i1.p1  ORF type:complete len:527 (-),score=122.67 TRINITY_DN2413_c1_g1_i1:34-1614(-)
MAWSRTYSICVCVLAIVVAFFLIQQQKTTLHDAAVDDGGVGVGGDGEVDSSLPQDDETDDQPQGRKYELKNPPVPSFSLESMLADRSVLRNEFLRRGWKEHTGNYNGYTFKWTFSTFGLKDSMMSSPQRYINHFPNHAEVGTKEGLLRNLNRARASEEGGDDSTFHADISSFFPRAYLLHKDDTTLDETDAFLKDFERTKGNSMDEGTDDLTWPLQPDIDGSRNMWISKPASGARGVGISIHNDTSGLNSSDLPDTVVVQKYIEAPLLVKGLKFDIRQFVLVTSLDPLIIFFFDDNYLRFTTVDYDTDDMSNLLQHLTNHQIQKDSPNFRETKIPDSQWSLKTFKDHLNVEYGAVEGGVNGDVWDSLVLPKIEKVVVTSLRTWPKEGHRARNFELLGLDIMLDDELNPYLLEVNTNPGTHLLTDVVKKHHPVALVDLLKVVLDCEEHWRDDDSIETAEQLRAVCDCGKWRLLYKGKSTGGGGGGGDGESGGGSGSSSGSRGNMRKLGSRFVNINAMQEQFQAKKDE